MANSFISATALDFDEIKDSLIAYFRTKDEFTDYDFTGSALNQLLDVLAFNTHYAALLANFDLNESFLDSAAKRSSTVSKAKSLGYVPKSTRGSRVQVDAKYSYASNIGLESSFTIPKGTVFTVNNSLFKNISFFVQENINTPLEQEGSLWVYNFKNVKLIEGVLLTNTFNVTNVNAKFQIPNQNVDTSTITVLIKNTSNSKSIPYLLNDDITSIDSNSTVFFLQESTEGFYEIYFGDGILGSKLILGDVVEITYSASNGELGNNIKNFITDYKVHDQTPFVTLSSNNDRSSSGTYKEDIGSIKFNAPKYRASLGRGLTPTDYKILLANLYDNIDSITSWGGEDNIPPQYGKVFISIKPKSGDFLSSSSKQEIINQILKGKNVVSITPVIIDPEFIYLSIDSKVFYDPLIDRNSLTILQNSVINSILTYNDTALKKFGGTFKYSQLIKSIDSTNVYISSNITNIKMYREFIVGNQASYIVNFFNGIAKPKIGETSITTSAFNTNGSNLDFFLEDYIDSTNQGRLRLYYNGVNELSGGVKKIIVNDQAGIVDYGTGKITIQGVDFKSNNSTLLKIITSPFINDLYSVRNNLFEIRSGDITVNIQEAI